jgi:hypothetical protein
MNQSRDHPASLPPIILPENRLSDNRFNLSVTIYDLADA